MKPIIQSPPAAHELLDAYDLLMGSPLVEIEATFDRMEQAEGGT